MIALDQSEASICDIRAHFTTFGCPMKNGIPISSESGIYHLQYANQQLAQKPSIFICHLYHFSYNASFSYYIFLLTKTFTSQSLNLTCSKIEKFFSTRLSSAFSFTGTFFLISSLKLPLLLWSALKMLETRLA